MLNNTFYGNPPGTIAARLAKLDLELPQVPNPVAAYVPALKVGDQVWTSGQLPFVDGELKISGKVGEGHGLVDPKVAEQLAATAVLNALAAVNSRIGSLDQITRILKVVGFVASDPLFTGQPQVVNGASKLLAEIFGDAGSHVRSAVGVAALPLDSQVEIELVVEVSER